MSNANILIVEDDRIVAEDIKGCLIDLGHSVSGIIPSGEEALKLLSETRPDLVLMDVVMPGMNGFQATRQISKNTETSSIPVIMVTTKDQETDKVWAMRQGAKDYIVKPVETERLITAVHRAISFQELQRENRSLRRHMLRERLEHQFP